MTKIMRSRAARSESFTSWLCSEISWGRSAGCGFLIQSVGELVELIDHMEGYFTRNSFSGDGPAGEEGLNQAADWAAAQFAGYGFEVARPSFREDMTPQVIAELRGSEEPERVVVVGAHYDSRGTLSSSPTQRAPGACSWQRSVSCEL